MDDTEVYYDPYDVGINADPYPTYARLREHAPLYYNEKYDFWAISRHSDVEWALAHWETFSNRRSDILELVQSKFDMPRGVMMFQDPPEHTRLRGLMSRVFTPRRMAEIEDQIRRYCIRCLDPLVGSSGFDIIAELASMMPTPRTGTCRKTRPRYDTESAASHGFRCIRGQGLIERFGVITACRVRGPPC